MSLLPPECAVCVCLCVISNQSTSKKPNYVSGLCKLDTLWHKTKIKVLLVLRYQGLTCLDPLSSLSKIAHQMWHDHPLSQRNRTTERTVGVGVECDREVVEGKQYRQYRGFFIKQGVSIPLPTM